MNKMKLIKAFVVILLLPLSIIAQADNPSDQLIFHYSGNVVISPCTVGIAKYDIDFGELNSEALAETGNSSDWKDIHLALMDCSNVNYITMTLSDNVDADNNHYFASTGTAKHVAVELHDPGGMTTIPGRVITTQINGAPGIDFNYQVRIVNDGSGAATSGTVESTITVNYEFK